MKIGLFGGTFNPIHRCHLVTAAQVRTLLSLDRVIFIPTGDAPHKPFTSLAPAEHRLEMVRLAVPDDPGFAVSDMEVRRPTKSYSIDTIEAFRYQFPGQTLFFIVGVDAFQEFPTWREAPRLLYLCHFVVVSRPGTTFLSLAALPLLPKVDPDALRELDQGSRTMLTIPGGEQSGLTLLRLPPCDASASEIRRRIRAHEALANLLPASVESYIIRSGLYQEESDRTGV